MNYRQIITIFLCGIFVSGCGQTFFGPADYNACVLQGLQEVEEASEAAAVRERCRKQFPGPIRQQRSTTLEPEALRQLRFNADIFFDQYVRGTLFNDNPEVIVTEVVFGVRLADSPPDKQLVYTEQVHITPNENYDILIEVQADEPIASWRILDARGFVE